MQQRYIIPDEKNVLQISNCKLIKSAFLHERHLSLTYVALNAIITHILVMPGTKMEGIEALQDAT